MGEEPARPVPVTLRCRGVRADRLALRELIRHCLEQEGAPPGQGVGLLLAGSRLVRRLNRVWLGRDRPTDVLSFPYGTPAGPMSGEPEEMLLGEVVVSVPQCAAQARERGVATGVELVRLVVHGTLHVLGHDHERPAERARMAPRERRLAAWAAGRGIGPRCLAPSTPRASGKA
jgi:rRNA maturation RNase YbeY